MRITAAIMRYFHTNFPHSRQRREQIDTDRLDRSRRVVQRLNRQKRLISAAKLRYGPAKPANGTSLAARDSPSRLGQPAPEGGRVACQRLDPTPPDSVPAHD